MRALGTLSKWNADRGFGFIRLRDSGVDIFVHITAFPRSGRQPQIGDALSFDVFTASDGRKQAKAVAYDVPPGRADFTLAPIERVPIERAPAAHASKPMPSRISAPDTGRHRRPQPQREPSGRLYTLFFGVLLIGGLAFGYTKFLEYRAVAVDTLHAQNTDPVAAPAAATTATSSSGYRCDGREHCSQMSSCAEATWFIRHCPNTKMDGDNDGIPCEQGICN
jgi:cold shock CspA family protein